MEERRDGDHDRRVHIARDDEAARKATFEPAGGKRKEHVPEDREEERSSEETGGIERGNVGEGQPPGEPGESEDHHQEPRPVRGTATPFHQACDAPGEPDTEGQQRRTHGRRSSVTGQNQRRTDPTGGERRRPESEANGALRVHLFPERSLAARAWGGKRATSPLAVVPAVLAGQLLQEIQEAAHRHALDDPAHEIRDSGAELARPLGVVNGPQ